MVMLADKLARLGIKIDLNLQDLLFEIDGVVDGHKL